MNKFFYSFCLYSLFLVSYFFGGVVKGSRVICLFEVKNYE